MASAFYAPFSTIKVVLFLSKNTLTHTHTHRVPGRHRDLFAPFVIESFGGLGEKALDLIKAISEEGACIDAQSYRISKQQFMAWLSVMWQRHNYKIYTEWSKLCQSARRR